MRKDRKVTPIFPSKRAASLGDWTVQDDFAGLPAWKLRNVHQLPSIFWHSIKVQVDENFSPEDQHSTQVSACRRWHTCVYILKRHRTPCQEAKTPWHSTHLVPTIPLSCFTSKKMKGITPDQSMTSAKNWSLGNLPVRMQTRNTQRMNDYVLPAHLLLKTTFLGCKTTQSAFCKPRGLGAR